MLKLIGLLCIQYKFKGFFKSYIEFVTLKIMLDGSTKIVVICSKMFKTLSYLYNLYWSNML